MYEFKVKDMHCESCADAMGDVIKGIDPTVEVSVSLENQTVKVKSQRTINELSRLIEETGYPVLDSRTIS